MYRVQEGQEPVRRRGESAFNTSPSKWRVWPSRLPACAARAGSADVHLQAPCRRCQLAGISCIFEKPEKKNAQVMGNASVEYVVHLTPIHRADRPHLIDDFRGWKANTLCVQHVCV